MSRDGFSIRGSAGIGRLRKVLTTLEETLEPSHVEGMVEDAAKEVGKTLIQQYKNAEYAGDPGMITCDVYRGKPGTVYLAINGAKVGYIEYGTGPDHKGEYPGKLPPGVPEPGSTLAAKYAYKFNGSGDPEKVQIKNPKGWVYYGVKGNGDDKTHPVRKNRPKKSKWEQFWYEDDRNASGGKRLRSIDFEPDEKGVMRGVAPDGTKLTLAYRGDLDTGVDVVYEFGGYNEEKSTFRGKHRYVGKDPIPAKSSRSKSVAWYTRGNKPAAIMYHAKPKLAKAIREELIKSIQKGAKAK